MAQPSPGSPALCDSSIWSALKGIMKWIMERAIPKWNRRALQRAQPSHPPASPCRALPVRRPSSSITTRLANTPEPWWKSANAKPEWFIGPFKKSPSDVFNLLHSRQQRQLAPTVAQSPSPRVEVQDRVWDGARRLFHRAKMKDWEYRYQQYRYQDEYLYQISNFVTVFLVDVWQMNPTSSELLCWGHEGPTASLCFSVCDGT